MTPLRMTWLFVKYNHLPKKKEMTVEGIRKMLEMIQALSEENATLKRENLFLQTQVSSLKKWGWSKSRVAPRP